MIANWREIKVGSKFKHDADFEGEVLTIDQYGRGTYKDLKTGHISVWDFTVKYDLVCMTLINPEPLVFKPFHSTIFVSGTTVYRYAGD